MYELTALRPAFTAFNIHGLVNKIKKAVVAPLPNTYSAEWCATIRAMLRKRPENRPTVQELLAVPCMRQSLIEARERALKLMPDLKFDPLPEPMPIMPSRPATPLRGGGEEDDDEDEVGLASEPPASRLPPALP